MKTITRNLFARILRLYRNAVKIVTISMALVMGLSYLAYGQPLAGTDELNRTLPQSNVVGEPVSGKTVVMFYFLVQGSWGADVSHTYWDLTDIVANHPSVLNNFNDPYWGTTTAGAAYFWGQSIYNYYKADDYWVHLKNIQLLTDAGVDVLAIDATNMFIYAAESEVLMQAMDAVRAQGKNPPKIVYYTYNGSGATMQACYDNFYKTGAPYYHPNCWFYLDGKPLIIGKSSEAVGKNFQTFFTYREPAMPFDPLVTNGWPWIDFVKPQRVYTNSAGQAEITSVSVAQNVHPDQGMGGSAFYGFIGNMGRSYHNGSVGNPSTDMPYGYNVQEEWDAAISYIVPFIFVTGWNEWVVGRGASLDGNPNHSWFCDVASPEFSRDIEPTLTSTGNMKDNYYMQLVSNIRRYKGVESSTPLSASVNISDMSDWTSVTPAYSDYTGDVGSRNHAAAPTIPTIIYTNTTGRNDFSVLKVARSSTNLYFYAKTVANITTNSGSNWMRLYLDLDRNASTGWKGYDYRVTGNTLQKYDNGAWTTTNTITCTVSGTEMYYTIPRSYLGNIADPLNLEFKWSDNMQDDTNPLDWYVNGDAAPGGRFNYIAMTEIPSGIINSGFETPALTQYQFGPFTNGWTFVAPAGIQHNGSAFLAPNAPEGVQSGYVQRNGYFTQNVNFAAGTYRVRFYAAQRSGSTQTIKVYYDDTEIGSITPSSSTNWNIYVTNAFTATAGVHTIKFAGAQTADHTAFIDAVYIELQTTTNTGFEIPSIPSYQFGPFTNGWEFVAPAGIQHNGSAFLAPNAPEGVQTAVLQRNGYFSQTFTFTNGTYKVSFYGAQRPGYTQTIKVYYDDTEIGSITPTSSTNWNIYYTNSFTATAGDHTIKFAGYYSSDQTAFVDAVDIVLQTTLSNTGFETPSLTQYQFGPFTNGWTFGVLSGVQHNGSAFLAPNAPEGVQTAFVQRNGSFYQDFNFAEGGSYRLSFYGAQRPGYTPQTICVYLDNTLIAFITPSSSSQFNYYTTSSFFVTAGNHRIRFSGYYSSDQTAFIDGVRLSVGGTKSATIETDSKEVPVSDNGIMLYPNPVSDRLDIAYSGSNAVVEVYDLNGMLVFSKVYNATPAVIDVKGFADGVYLLKIKNNNNVTVKKFVVKK